LVKGKFVYIKGGATRMKGTLIGGSSRHERSGGGIKRIATGEKIREKGVAYFGRDQYRGEDSSLIAG